MSRLLATASVTLAALALAACGSSPSTSPEAVPSATPTSSLDVGAASTTTPVSAEVLTAAKGEGTVLVYGNPNDDQMAPVIKAFGTAHPDIKVRYLSLGGPETFQRYESEKATGQATADLIIESDGRLWRDLAAKGDVQDYKDPNLANLPDYADLLPGVAAVSMDPLVALFNKKILPEDQQPTSLAEFAAMSGKYKGKIATYAVDTALGYAGVYTYTQSAGEPGWQTLEALGPNTTTETSAGTMVTKLVQGAYVATFGLSGAVRALAVGEQGDVVNFRYLTDDTPLVPRGIGITKAASSPNAAKVFYNFLLSVEGQTAACKGGFTPYRDGVECAFGVPGIVKALGTDKVLFGNYAPSITEGQDALKSRFDAAFTK